MAQYGNGLLPKEYMRTFAGKYGHPTLIAHLNAFVAECKANGINITVAAGQDIYRDHAGQVYWKNYWTRQGKPGNAATPGTSNHGWGKAADISGCGNWGTALHRKCEQIAAKHSLKFTVASESWHIEDISIPVVGGKVSLDAGSVSGGGNRFFNRAQYRNVQGGYRAIGYDLGAGGQDGIEGPRMKAIIRDFQAKHGLPVDGVHGPKTEAALVAAQPKAPAPTPAPSSGAVLKKGSKGAAVTKLQQTLNAKYPAYSKLRVDGDFGAGTDKVVREFQRRAGLKVDGIVGAGTRAKLGI